jgi:MFS family permease
VPVLFVAPLAGRLSDRVGSRPIVATGLIVLTGSLVLFARMGTSESFWTLLPAMMLAGVGMAMAMPPTTAAAMRSVRAEKAGVGSAVLNTMRQVGGSLGIAVMGAIVAASITPGNSDPNEFLHGFHHALETAAALTLAGSVIALLTLGGRPRQGGELAGVPAEAG